MGAAWNGWISDRRKELGLSCGEFAELLRRHGATHGVDARQVGRWGRGEIEPGPTNRAALRAALGQPPWEAVTEVPKSSDTQADIRCGLLTAVERRDFLAACAAAGLGLPADQLHRLLGSVARESAVHAAETELSNVGPVALEQLREDVSRLAHAYVAGPPQPLIAEMILTLDEVKRRLKGHQWPAQTADLYLLVGQLQCLLANASLDFGDLGSAATQARSAWAYGEVIGHDGLRAFARGMESMIARWAGRPAEAAELARSGQMYASSGTPRARLYALEARALGSMGAAEEVALAIARAEEALGLGHDDLHDGVRGEFGLPEARLAYIAGGAFTQAGDFRRGAEQAGRAINLYQSGPAVERSYGCECLSYIDRARAHVGDGELEGAIVVLQPVFQLPQTHHLTIFAHGMAELQGLLRRPVYRNAGRARELLEAIEDFHDGLPARRALPA